MSEHRQNCALVRTDHRKECDCGVHPAPAREAAAPMTEERLAAIQRMHADAGFLNGHVSELLREVERLRAVESAS